MKLAKVPQGFFLIYGLILTNLWLAGYTLFVHYFQSGQEYKIQVHGLQQKISSLEEDQKLIQHQLFDFQQTVAEVMPAQKEMIAQKWNPRAVSLSSRIRLPASLKPLDLSDVYFEKGKKFFNQKDYLLAFKEFQGLTEKFPMSDRFIESQFLSVEAAYLLKDYKKVIELTDFLVSQYPENKLTGYAMLRLAQVSEFNSQFDEALAIYQVVQKNFVDADLKKQAKELEKRIKFE